MRLEKRSFSLAGHRTSVALEPEFWAVLERAAEGRLLALVARLDADRDPLCSVASSLRVWALAWAGMNCGRQGEGVTDL